MSRSFGRPFAEPLERRTFLSAGSLDPTFGQAGVVTVADTQRLSTAVTATAAAPGGKVVLVGTTTVDTDGNAEGAVGRLDASGQPDSTFGLGGVAALAYPGYGSFRATPVAVDANGDTLVAGNVVGRRGRKVAALARLLPDGSLDATFGDAGWVALPFGSDALVNAVAAATDGSYVIAGATGSSPDASFALARLKADGTIDDSFGRHGYAVVQFTCGRRHPQTLSTEVQALSVQTDGSILAVGGGIEPVIARLTPSGALDTTFGSYGTLGLPSLAGSFNAVTVGGGGEIFAAGGASGASGASTATLVAAVTPGGRMVPTFGDDGVVLQFTGTRKRRASHAVANGVALTAGGQVVVAGSVRASSVNGPLIERFNADGSPDATFGVGGVGVFSAADAYGTLAAVGLIPLADGAYAVPYFGASVPFRTVGTPLQTRGQFRAAAFNADGSVDDAFGTSGLAEVDGPVAPGKNVVDVAAVTGNTMFATGSTIDGGSFVAEYDADGQVVTSFGTDGRVGIPAENIVYGGKVFGVVSESLNSHKLERFNLDGTLDLSFGTDGGVGFGVVFNVIQGVYPRADGSVLVSTFEQAATTFSNSSLIALDASGNEVASLWKDTSTGRVGDTIQQATSEPDGTTYALVVNSAGEGAPSTHNIQRFSADLTPDLSYGVSGAAALDAVPFVSFASVDFAVAPDGSVYYFAQTNFNTGGETLARLTPAGVLDASFGQGGYVLLSGGPLSGIAVQPDGKLIAATLDDPSTATLERFNLDGSLDVTFGAGGRSVIDPGVAGQVGAVPAAFQVVNGHEELLVNGTVGVGTLNADGVHAGGTVGFVARVEL